MASATEIPAVRTIPASVTRAPSDLHPGYEWIAWMGLWYGTLYLVAEGWQALGLQQILELLTSPNTELLRR